MFSGSDGAPSVQEKQARVSERRRSHGTAKHASTFVAVSGLVAAMCLLYVLSVRAQFAAEETRAIRLLARSADVLGETLDATLTNVKNALRDGEGTPRERLIALAERQPYLSAPYGEAQDARIELDSDLVVALEGNHRLALVVSARSAATGQTEPVDATTRGERLLSLGVDLDRILSELPVVAAVDGMLVLNDRGDVIHRSRAQPDTIRIEALEQSPRATETIWVAPLGLSAAGARGDESPASAGDRAGAAAAGSLRWFVPRSKLVCQPLVVAVTGPVPVRLRLCGFIDSGAMLRSALSFAHVPILLFLVSAGVCVLPILKFALMDRRERFLRRDVCWLFASMFGLAALTTLAGATVHAYLVLGGAMGRQLEAIAGRLEQSFSADLIQARLELWRYDSHLPRLFERRLERGPVRVRPLLDQAELLDAPTTGALTCRRHQAGSSSSAADCANSIDADESLPGPIGLRGPHSVFWASPTGKTFAKATTARRNTAFIDVGHREYFRVASQADWSARGFRKFYLEPIRSLTTSERLAILSKASILGRARPTGSSRHSQNDAVEHPEGGAVAALAWLPPSVAAPVLPRSFGFAIFSLDGTVLFHSDRRREGFENLLDEVSEPERLKALVGSRTPDAFTTTYSARPHRFYVTPLPDTPWSIATFYDDELPRTIAIDAAGIALGWLLFYAVLLAVALAAATVFGRRPHDWLSAGARRGDTGLVLPLAAVALVLLGATWLTPKRLAPAWTGVACVLLPLLVVGLWVLLHTRSRSGRENATASVTSSTLTLIGDRWMTIGDRWAPWRQPLGWMVLAVLPALGLYRASFAAELTALLRLEMLHGRQALNESYRQLHTGLASVSPREEAVCRQLERWADPRHHHLYSTALQLLPADPKGVPVDLSQGLTDEASIFRMPAFNEASLLLHYAAGRPDGVALGRSNRSASASGVSDDELRRLFHLGGCASPPPNGRLSFELLHAASPTTKYSSDELVGALGLWCFAFAGGLTFLHWSRRVGRQLAFEKVPRPTDGVSDSVQNSDRPRIVVAAACQEAALASRWDGLVIDALRTNGRELERDRRAPVLVVGLGTVLGSGGRPELLGRLEHAVLAEPRPVTIALPRDPFEASLASIEHAAHRTPAQDVELTRWQRLLSGFELHFAAVDADALSATHPGSRASVWDSCSMDEKLVLRQLARGCFVNPKQEKAAASLLRRRLIRLDPTPQLESAELRDFLRHDDDASSLEREAQQGHEAGWRTARWFAITPLALLGGAILVTEPDMFRSAAGVIGSLGATVPVLARLIRGLRGED